MDRDQSPSSNPAIRQDFRDSVRCIFFETGYEGWEYATHGGTAFIISFRGKAYAVTCHHVFGDFDYHQLFITPGKFGNKGDKPAHIKGVFRPSSPRAGAIGTDICDLCVMEFTDDIDVNFFKGSAYVVEPDTIAQSRKGHRLKVAGALKDKSEIIPPDITVGFCVLEFVDAGTPVSDPFLRQGVAEIREPEFTRITGLSGSPVFDETANGLCGMVMRGAIEGNSCQIYYIDMSDIMKFLEALHAGASSTYYLKSPSA